MASRRCGCRWRWHPASMPTAVSKNGPRWPPSAAAPRMSRCVQRCARTSSRRPAAASPCGAAVPAGRCSPRRGSGGAAGRPDRQRRAHRRRGGIRLRAGRLDAATAARAAGAALAFFHASERAAVRHRRWSADPALAEAGGTCAASRPQRRVRYRGAAPRHRGTGGAAAAAAPARARRRQAGPRARTAHRARPGGTDAGPQRPASICPPTCRRPPWQIWRRSGCSRWRWKKRPRPRNGGRRRRTASSRSAPCCCASTTTIDEPDRARLRSELAGAAADADGSAPQADLWREWQERFILRLRGSSGHALLDDEWMPDEDPAPTPELLRLRLEQLRERLPATAAGLQPLWQQLVDAAQAPAVPRRRCSAAPNSHPKGGCRSCTWRGTPTETRAEAARRGASAGRAGFSAAGRERIAGRTATGAVQAACGAPGDRRPVEPRREAGGVGSASARKR